MNTASTHTIVSDAPLADRFAGRRQLLMQYFMFGPGWRQGCPSCSYDHTDGISVHFAKGPA